MIPTPGVTEVKVTYLEVSYKSKCFCVSVYIAIPSRPFVKFYYPFRDQATGRLGRNSRPKGLKVALGSPEGDKNFALRFLQLLKKLVLVQNELFVGRNPVKIEQTCKGKNLLKNVVRCIRNATE